jgi:hypothetical protein
MADEGPLQTDSRPGDHALACPAPAVASSPAMMANSSSVSWRVAGLVSIGLHGWLAGFVAIWGHFAPGAAANEGTAAGSIAFTPHDGAMVIFLDTPQLAGQTPSTDLAATSPPSAEPFPQQAPLSEPLKTPPPQPIVQAPLSTEMPMRLGSVDARSEFAAAWLQSMVDGEHAAELDGFDQAQLDQQASPDGSTGLRAQPIQAALLPGLPGNPGAPGAPGEAIAQSADGPGDLPTPPSRAEEARRLQAQRAAALLEQPQQEAKPEKLAIEAQAAIQPALTIDGAGPAAPAPQPASQARAAQAKQEAKPRIDGAPDGESGGLKDLPPQAKPDTIDPSTPIGPITQADQAGIESGTAKTPPTPPTTPADPALPVSESPQTSPAGLGVNPQPADQAAAISGQSGQSGDGGEQGQGGTQATKPTTATPSTAPRGPKADRDSDAASLRRSAIYRNGKVDAGKGLDIRTVRPEFSLTTRALTTPASPRVEIAFNRRGFVERVKVLTSSGYVAEVDQPIITALYNWRARGEVLDQLPAGPDSLLTLELTIVLR